MLLQAEDAGLEFELRPVAYQFPDPTGFAEDANWLQVLVRIETWQRTDPCLTIGEVHELASWLAAQGNGQDTIQELRFLEPNLSMAVSARAGGRVELRIHLAAECRPPDPFPANLHYILNPRDLLAAAMELRAELNAFPVRIAKG